MADALRVARRVPGFYDALAVHLVETASRLAATQAETLRDHPGVTISAQWPQSTQLAAGPVIVLANEFVDACPVEQFVFHDGTWRLRLIGLDAAGDFTFVAGKGTYPEFDIGLTPSEGDVFEVSDVAADLSRYLAKLALDRPVAALFIDYGHTAPAFGDTLQGVRAHTHVPPLTMPGETDLSTQVDFAALSRALRSAPARVLDAVVEPVTTQAEFLGTIGIVERASRLMAANPASAGAIEVAIARLMAPGGMGTRFKVLGYRCGIPGPLPGFPAP
jgi:NADH dehydrogenase [ubiquinone] 1 alpha subcomplex assembly factor 7